MCMMAHTDNLEQNKCAKQKILKTKMLLKMKQIKTLKIIVFLKIKKKHEMN